MEKKKLMFLIFVLIAAVVAFTSSSNYKTNSSTLENIEVLSDDEFDIFKECPVMCGMCMFGPVSAPGISMTID